MDAYDAACKRCYHAMRRVETLRRRLNDNRRGDAVYDSLMEAEAEYAIAEAAWYDLYRVMTGEDEKEVT